MRRRKTEICIILENRNITACLTTAVPPLRRDLRFLSMVIVSVPLCHSTVLLHKVSMVVFEGRKGIAK